MNDQTAQMSDTEVSFRAWRLFGAATQPSRLIPLRAGPLRLWFDPSNGFVRRLRLGEKEVLRGIYAAVRDRNWSTVIPKLSNLNFNISEDSFQLSFQADCRQDELHFVWQGKIQGGTDGSLRYTFDGEARTTFLRNRIGFCVLHPIHECAGNLARQQRVDGSLVQCRFPETIEPQRVGLASFRELTKLSHAITPTLWGDLEFEGDVFETEDQRNWTDASFKTYCTPLALPFPAEIRAGTRVSQSVRFSLSQGSPAADVGRVTYVPSPKDIDPPTLVIPDEPTKDWPHIGLTLASHGHALTAAELTKLAELHLHHLRVDLRLSTPDCHSTWKRAVREAQTLGIALELATHVPGRSGAELAQLEKWLRTESVPLARVLALPEGGISTTIESLQQLKNCLANFNLPIGAGSDGNFCELNREQAVGNLPVADADFIFWSANPQVHAFDPLSIIETIEAHPHTVTSARTFAGQKPLVVSPITLKPRFNAVATQAHSISSADALPTSVDPRQMSLFGAVWTLGTVAALAASGVDSITLFETTGWHGLMEQERGSARPGKFPSLPGEVFPVFMLLHLLAGTTRFASCGDLNSSNVSSLALWNQEQRRRVILGNLTAEPQQVRLLTSSTQLIFRMLTADCLSAPGSSSSVANWRRGALAAGSGEFMLTLEPYALGVVEP